MVFALKKTRQRTNRRGQVSVEMAFAFIVLLFLVYAAITAFRWAGFSLATGIKSHEDSLKVVITEDWTDPFDGPLRQLDTDFYEMENMNLIMP